jgi:hypothetical protein
MSETMIALGVAAIGFLGVALGAIVTGYVTLRQARLATEREREAQQMLREQEREDTRDDFQRDAIIVLHTALAAYWQTILAANRQIHGLTEAERETVDADPIYEPVRADYWRMTAARAKVFDDELCGLVKKISGRIDVAINWNVQQAPAQEALEESYRLMEKIEERITTLLKQLF